jgi:hypothetical protein
MICAPCKKAGKLLKKNRNPKYMANVKIIVIKLHNECESPATCPCHHRTESVLSGQSAK